MKSTRSSQYTIIISFLSYCLAARTAREIKHSNNERKTSRLSLFYLALLDLIRRGRRYIFTAGDRLSWGDILVTAVCNALGNILPTSTLYAICRYVVAKRQVVGRQFAAAKITRTNIDR